MTLVKIAYAHDGTSIYDTLFLEELVKGNKVYFVTFNHKPIDMPEQVSVVHMREPLDKLTKNIDKFEALRMYLLFLFRGILLRLILRKTRPQLVIGCMATKYGFYSALAGFKPTILIVWGSDVLIAPKRFILFRFMVKYALSKAAAVIVDSEIQKKAVLQLGCYPGKVLKFPWFDLEKIRPQKSRNELRKNLGWQNNTIIISARSHETIYGVEYLIEAIPFILKEAPEARFLLLGKGRLTEKLKQRVCELKVTSYVKFLRSIPQQDVVEYVNAADINVSTSFSDGTSASLLEAMALSVPSVVSEIPGNKEWIENGWNGYLTPIKDPKGLAEKIITLIENTELARRFGENARKTVEARVDWRRSMSVFDNLILTLLDKKSKLPITSP